MPQSPPLLAELLHDNAALHALYAQLAGAARWSDGALAAMRHVESLAAATSHGAIRDECRRVSEALGRLAAVPDDVLPAHLHAARAERELPQTAREARDMLLVREQLLRHRLEVGAAGIPRIVHLVRTDDADRDLPLLQFLCYRSVLAHCAGYRLILHTPSVPRGARWDRLLPHLELDVATTPQWLGHHRLIAAAHQSDVWRLKQVIAHGGFYFDWDLLLLQAPDALRDEVCVLALERQESGYDEVLGVSAIGAPPGSPFLQEWLAAMPSVYNPRRYLSHSTVLARSLAMKWPSLVRVHDHRAFYDPGWGAEGMRWLFDPALRLPEDELRAHLAGCTGMHLFCSHANFLHWAHDMTEQDVAAARCNLAALMRPYL